MSTESRPLIHSSPTSTSTRGHTASPVASSSYTSTIRAPMSQTRPSPSKDSRPPSPSDLPPLPGSPTYSYASTALPLPSTYNLPPPPPPRTHAVLNKTDLESSHTAYTELLTSAKAYRLSLSALSLSASTFGSALEACARLKEARSETMAPPGGSMTNSFSTAGTCTADNLLTSSGLHQLIANHHQILSETVYRNFEVPLLHELDQWQRRIDEEEDSYLKEAKRMSREIRRMEKEGLKLHRQRKRDVGVFREHLVTLTGKLDALTGLSGGHSRGLLRDCQEMSKGIVECSAGLVRAEVDIFEALARKGWNGGGLDELLEKGKDFFASENETDSHPNHSSKIFSILPQGRSILAVDSGDGAGKPSMGDSFLVGSGEGNGGYQSLAGAVTGNGNGNGNGGRDIDVLSIFSERDMGIGMGNGILNRSRGVRPFSPVGERVRDPLEDYSPVPSIPHITSDLEDDERVGNEDDDGQGKEDERDERAESNSTKTMKAVLSPIFGESNSLFGSSGDEESVRDGDGSEESHLRGGLQIDEVIEMGGEDGQLPWGIRDDSDER